MKYTVVAASIAALLAAPALAFAPAPRNGRVSVAQDALADKIFGMDLFAPNKDINDYGSRAKKNLKQGKITDNSYIPAGLTKAQYEQIRAKEAKKKEDNYQRNVKKAGVFTDYTQWYTKRGTDLDGSWKKDVTLGHRMAKTKYDWSGVADAKKFESTNTEGFLAGLLKTPTSAAKKKAAPAKKGAAAPKKKSFF